MSQISRKPTPESDARKAECIRIHVEENRGVTYIAKRLKMNKSLVRKWLKKAGVYRIGGRTCAPVEPKKLPLYVLIARNKEAQNKKLERERLKIRTHKTCIECKAEKSVEEFYRQHSGRGYLSRCKKCHNVKTAEAKRLDPHYREKFNAWRLNRYRTEPGFRLRSSMSSRLSMLLSGRLKDSKDTMRYVGCALEFLMTHLEKSFKKGMTWDNYGNIWHVDHIIPCARYNHNEEEQVKRCWNWQNLQPMFAMENVKKGDKLKDRQEKLSLCF